MKPGEMDYYEVPTTRGETGGARVFFSYMAK